MNTRYKRMSIIFLIAATLRLLLFLVIGPWQDEVLKTIVSDDGSRYHRIAVNLVENRVFSTSEIPPYLPHTFTTPIYPLFLSLVYAIFGQKPYITILLQNIIDSIICVLTLKIGNKLFDEKTAFWAGLLVAFEYSSISLNELLATDTLFTFLFIIHIYLLVNFIISNSNILLVSSAIFLGLSTLCRPVSVYFFTFIAGVFLLHFRRNLREGIFKYSILILVFLLAIAPWVVRNYIVSGKFLVSSAQERVLHWNLPHFFNDPQTSEKEVPSQQIRRIPNPSHDPSRTRNDNQGVPTKKNSLNAVLSDSKRYADGMIRFFIVIGSSRFPALLGLPSYRIQREDWDKGLCEAVRVRKDITSRIAQAEPGFKRGRIV